MELYQPGRIKVLSSIAFNREYSWERRVSVSLEIYGIFCLSSSGSEEFIEVFSSDNSSSLAANFDLALPWRFLIHGFTDSMFTDPKWKLNGRGIFYQQF